MKQSFFQKKIINILFIFFCTAILFSQTFTLPSESTVKKQFMTTLIFVQKLIDSDTLSVENLASLEGSSYVLKLLVNSSELTDLQRKLAIQVLDQYKAEYSLSDVFSITEHFIIFTAKNGIYQSEILSADSFFILQECQKDPFVLACLPDDIKGTFIHELQTTSAIQLEGGENAE